MRLKNSLLGRCGIYCGSCRLYALKKCEGCLNIYPTVEEAKETHIKELTDYLQHNWKVAFVWISENRQTVSGVILMIKTALL